MDARLMFPALPSTLDDNRYSCSYLHCLEMDGPPRGRRWVRHLKGETRSQDSRGVTSYITTHESSPLVLCRTAYFVPWNNAVTQVETTAAQDFLNRLAKMVNSAVTWRCPVSVLTAAG